MITYREFTKAKAEQILSDTHAHIVWEDGGGRRVPDEGRNFWTYFAADGSFLGADDFGVRPIIVVYGAVGAQYKV